MKKKYGLFKVLSVLLLIVAIVTYFINDRQGTITYLALGDVILNYLQSFYYFFDTILFILVLGGFYGVLNKIPAYKELVKGIANKVMAKRKVFVIVITIAMALVASLTGLNGLLLLVVPFIVSVILLLGYDKLVALSATVGSIIVGFIGGVFVTLRDSSNYYSVSYTTIDKLVGLDSHFTNLLPKILLFVFGVGLLVWHIVSHIKKVEAKEVSYELTNDDVLFVDEESTNKKTKVVEQNKVRVWPLAVVLGLIFVLLVLGYLPWVDLFGLEVFNDFHKWLTAITFADYKYAFLVLFVLLLGVSIFNLVKKIKSRKFDIKMVLNIMAILIELVFVVLFASYCLLAKTVFGELISELSFWKSSVFGMLVSNNFGAFGTWAGLGNYMMAMVVLVVFTVVLALIYKIKCDDTLDGFVYGVKKMIPAALIVAFGYAVLVCIYNHGFVETIIAWTSDKFGDNAIVHSLVVLLGSILHVDLYYTTAGVFTVVTSTLTESANLAVYASLFQSLYGLVQLVGPTSIILVVGLSYLEVPYKTWLKYIWRFIVEVLIVILLVLMIISLL